MAEARPPVPPYTLETAALKARKAEDAWNTRNPQQVALAYTVDSRMAEPRRVPPRPGGHRGVPNPQVAA